MKNLLKLATPFARVPVRTAKVLLLGEVLLALVLWHLCAGDLIPRPGAVLERMVALVTSTAFLDDLLASLMLTLKGMGLSIVIALTLAYLSVVPLCRPLALVVVQARYLTLTGLVFLFTVLTTGGGQLKMSLLVFGIVPFFLTGLVAMIREIPQQEYDLCRTLRMGPWRTLWEVVIVGRADQVLDVVRQNFAIAWMMITMVEGLSMSEGGLGTLMIKSSKYIDLQTVFGILGFVLAIGLGSDGLLRKLRGWLFPYTR